MNFPLCQIFSVLLMGMLRSSVTRNLRIRERCGGVNRREVLACGGKKTNWRGERDRQTAPAPARDSGQAVSNRYRAPIARVAGARAWSLELFVCSEWRPLVPDSGRAPRQSGRRLGLDR